MRLTAFFLLAACLQLSAKGFSQKVTLRERNTPLKTILQKIKAQTGYDFFYNLKAVELAGNISVDVRQASIEETLDQCLKKTRLTWSIKDRIIIIENPVAPSAPPRADSALINPPPPEEISGIITDSSGTPIPGASIRLKGSKAGIASDANGRFVIRANPGDVLIITSTGYHERQIKVGAASSVNVTLLRNTQEMTSVVITALGIRREAKSLGYATAQIDNKDINSSQPVNFASGISGKVSGMDIAMTNSGVDPDNVRITLRGNRSFLGNNEPLLVVDGIPVDISYLAQINSADIANVNILKGATAAALYGSDAANGVMIVTTRGGSKKPVIQVSSTVTVDKVSFLPKMQNRFGSASNEFTGIDALSYSDPSNNQNGYVPYENQAFGAPFANGSPFGGDSIILGFPGPDGQIQKVAYRPLSNELKKFWNTGTTYRNGVSYAQGDEDNSFFLSGENIMRKGIVPKDKYNRTTFRMNAAKRFGRFKASGAVSYGESNLDQTAAIKDFYGSIQNTAPQVPITNYQNTNAVFGDLSTYFNAYAVNPYWYIANRRHTRNRKDLLASGDLSMDFTKWLNVSFQAGIENYNYVDDTTNAAFDFTPYGLFLGSPATLSGNQATYFANVAPTLQNEVASDRKLFTNLKILLHKKIGDFAGQLILGNSINQDDYNRLDNGSGTLLNVPGLYNVNFRSGTPTVDQFRTQSRKYGNYADFSINYKEWIFLHASGRQDKTSLLDASNHTFFYPGVDAALVLSEAIGLLKESRTISFLKIRGGVTKTGNVNINPYQIQNTFSVGPNFPYGQTAGLTTSGIYAKQNLKPEFTNSSEVGIELGLLNNRINWKGTYFIEKTTNETVPVNVSNSTGYGTYLENLGRMDNKGLELDLNADILRLANGLRWNVGINYTHYHSIVKSLGPVTSLGIPNGLNTSNAFAVVGQPYPVLQVIDWAKDPQGHVIVDANTGLPSQSATLVNFGPTNPTQAIGITTNVSYKGFTLAAVAEYRGGNVIYNGVGANMEVNGLSARSAMFNHNRFVYPNSVIETSPGHYAPNTNVTVNDGGLGFWGIYGYFPASMYVTSASFWTLRNASLSYQVPQRLVSRIKPVQAVTVSLIGSNLFLWLPKQNTWTDPEFSEDNGNATGTNSLSQAPPTRTFGANIKVTF
ncbi:MAG TPA: SusC/RagA family TonB-linked outer membrane protein [Puia sp.]|nr:SusC/RagA family TonB-linked outer membrane protein [Puia sp.]